MTDKATLSPEEANQLWEAYRSGSNPAAMRAIDTLYRALRPVLIEFCRSKGCDAELADEITEQAFFRLMHRKPPVEPRGSAGIEDTTPQKGFPSQNIFIDNELSDGRREARTWALASERRSCYALKEITSKAAWAMSGCGLPGSELPFC